MAEKVTGDPITVEKAVGKLAEFFIRDVTTGTRALPAGWDADMPEAVKKQLGVDFDEVKQQKTAQEVVDFLTDGSIQIMDPAGSDMIDLVTKALAMVARSTALTPVEEERILRMMQEMTAKGVTVPVLRRQLKEMRKGDITGESHMEIAQELLKQLLRSSEIRFSEGALHRWSGSMWEKVLEHDVLKHIATEFGHLPAAKRFSDHRGIMSVMHQLAAKPLKVADRLRQRLPDRGPEADPARPRPRHDLLPAVSL